MAEINVIELDLYELLGIEQSSTTKEIKTAYRKKALSCHPDKNPDDPKAAERFHTLTKCLEILIDASARAAYDKVLNAKKAAKIRNRHLDAKRKKLKEDLEAKEQASMRGPNVIVADYHSKPKTDEENLKAEIERLRKQGSRELKEEVEIVRKQVEEEWLKQKRESSEGRGTEKPCLSGSRLRLTWDIKDGKSAYNEESIRSIFSKYGAISAIVISSKPSGKRGGGIVEFEKRESAETALIMEKGFKGKIKSLQSGEHAKKDRLTPDNSQGRSLNDDKTEDVTNIGKSFPSFASPNISVSNSFPLFQGGSNSSSTGAGGFDFESLVLRRLRQAQERKRLEEEMKAEDEASG